MYIKGTTPYYVLWGGGGVEGVLGDIFLDTLSANKK
jgi:hypothetical protein